MPGLDVTPSVPAGRMVIQSYGGGRFRVADQVFETSIIVERDHCRAWSATSIGDLDAQSLHWALTKGADAPVDPGSADAALVPGGPPEILILGCGGRFVAPPTGFRPDMKALGIAVEWMDTGAACRTFNVLLGEERRVAAAILAIE